MEGLSLSGNSAALGTFVPFYRSVADALIMKAMDLSSPSTNRRQCPPCRRITIARAVTRERPGRCGKLFVSGGRGN